MNICRTVLVSVEIINTLVIVFDLELAWISLTVLKLYLENLLQNDIL